MKKNIFKLAIGFILLSTIHSCKKPDMTVVPPPGTTAVNNVMDFLKNQLNLSLFASAVEYAGLADSLAKKEYTVFAVDNIGFNNLGIYSSNDFKKWAVDSVKNLVKTHVVAGRMFYDEIPRSLDNNYESINGEKLLISFFSTASDNQDPDLYGNLFANGVPIYASPKLNPYDRLPNKYGSALLNGVVYTVATPFKSTRKNIQTFFTERPDFSIFVAGLKKFGLWDQLALHKKMTVFAPPDSVFLRHNITKDSIERMDLNHIKSLFMDAYITTFNKVFTTDVQSYTNISKFSTFFSDPVLLMTDTSDPDIGFVMFGGYGTFPYPGCFLFDNRILKQMPDHTGGQLWSYQILGSNKNSDPVYGELNTGYNIPFIGELRYIDYGFSVKGSYINYNFSNGVVHQINGLLLMPDEAVK